MKHLRILDQHSGTSSKGMANVMFHLEIAGLRFLHIGDNEIEWPDNVRQAVGEIDILMVTVEDSCHLLTYPEIDTLINMVQLRVVIPMHYQIPGLMSESTTLWTSDEWLAPRSRVRHLGAHHLSLSIEGLPETPETWVFEPSPESFTTPRVAPGSLGQGSTWIIRAPRHHDGVSGAVIPWSRVTAQHLDHSFNDEEAQAWHQSNTGCMMRTSTASDEKQTRS